MIPRKQWIEMNRITVIDRIRWFFDDYIHWILLGIVLGTAPFVPVYMAILANRAAEVLGK